MAIHVHCPLGHRIEVIEEYLGRRIVCPACEIVLLVNPGPPGSGLAVQYETHCPQGHLLRVKAHHLGRSIRCPSCRMAVVLTPENLVRQAPRAEPPPAVGTAEKALKLATVKSGAQDKPPVRVVKAIPLGLPGGQQASQAPAHDAIPTAELDEDEPPSGTDARPALTRDDRTHLALTGLRLSGAGITATLGVFAFGGLAAFLLLLFALAVETHPGRATLQSIAEVIRWIGIVGYLLAALAFLIGGVMELAAPSAMGSRPMAAGQVGATLVVAAALLVIELVGPAGPRGVAGMDGLSIAKVFLTLGGGFLAWGSYILLQWQWARFARRKHLPLRALYLLTAAFAFTVVLLLMAFLPLMIMITSRTSFWVYQTLLAMVSALGSLVLILWQVRLARDVYSSVNQRPL
jgi:hypothetical protein